MALFRCFDSSCNRTFVIELLDEKLIAQARKFAAGAPSQGVMGTVVAKPVDYNSPWSFHLAPDSISFFDNAIEVCDCATVYLQEHLGEIGGPFLPDNRWCPWSSKVIEEVVRSADGLRTL
jgi:hypothetical protein